MAVHGLLSRCPEEQGRRATSKMLFQPINRGNFVLQTSVIDLKRPNESSRAKSADIWWLSPPFFVLHRPCPGLLQAGAPKQGIFHKGKIRSGLLGIRLPPPPSLA